LITNIDEARQALGKLLPDFDRETVGTLLNAGNFRYYQELKANVTSGKCPFCDINRELNVVLFENNSWMIWINPVAKKSNGLATHLVAPAKRHILKADDITRDEWADWHEVWQFAFGQYPMLGGALFSRFGDPALNAGTIRHFHHNLYVPDGTKEYRPPLVKKPEEGLEALQIALAFEKMIAGTPFEELEPDERELVKKRL
jgi:hypothetical protein